MSPRVSVLVVDDDPEYRTVIKMVLEKFGLVPTLVGTAEEFKSLFHASRHGLVMMDLDLGGGMEGGLHLLDWFRRERGSATPVMIVSATSDQRVIAHCMEMGATDYLLKPFDRELLATKLAHYLKGGHLQEYQAPLHEVSAELSQAKIALDCRLEEIDEFGVRFFSEHLISKGTALKLGGEWVDGVFGDKQPLVTVNMTWLDSGRAGYVTYAEFDAVDSEQLKAIRQWIASSAGGAS